MDRKWVSILGVAVLLLCVGVGSFFAVRALSGGRSDVSAQGDGPTQQDMEAIEKAYEEYREKPAPAEVVNGILVGPDVQRPSSSECEINPARYVSESEAVGTDVEIKPSYVPEGVELTNTEVVACGNTVVLQGFEYRVPERLAEGRTSVRSFRDLAWAGGDFVVVRMLGRESRFPMNGPAEYRQAIEIAGKSAVLAKPFQPEGIDNGSYQFSLVIKESFGVTAVCGMGLPVNEFLKIAEGLYVH